MISPRSAGLGNTGNAPACSRLTSSRLAIRWASWSRDSSAVASSSSRSSAVSGMSREHRQLTAACAAATGVRRSWLTAASNAVRIRSASATARPASVAAASRCCPSAAAARAANALRLRRPVAASARPPSARHRLPVAGTVTAASIGRAIGGPPETATGVQPTARPARLPTLGPRSKRVTDSRPYAARTWSSTAVRASGPCRTLAAAVASSSHSAAARAACLVRRPASRTRRLTARATATNTPRTAALLASAIVTVCPGGMK
jgi:hypothetical protein